MSRLFTRASSHYLEVAAAIRTAAPTTMACWFYAAGTTLDYALVSLANSASETDYFLLQASGGTGGDPIRAEAASGGGVQAAASSSGFSANTWQHAAAVFASTTSRKAYVNGGSVGTDANSRTPSGINRSAIGRSTKLTPSQYMDGRIAEVGIWGVALAATEIAALANGVSPLLIRPASLSFYAPLWGVADPEVDYTVGRHGMTVSGAVQAPHAPVVPFLPMQSGFLPVSAPAGTVYSGSLGDLGFEFLPGALQGEQSEFVVDSPAHQVFLTSVF